MTQMLSIGLSIMMVVSFSISSSHIANAFHIPDPWCYNNSVGIGICEFPSSRDCKNAVKEDRFAPEETKCYKI